MRALRLGHVLAIMLGMTAAANAQTAAAEYGGGAHRFSLATGSPGELGLLKVLGEAFGKEADATLVWIKAGTGQSMQLLKERKVDMAMVHAPAQVDKAVVDGWATGKTLIGSNEFYLVGPASDPAGIAQARDVADAYQRIAAAKAKFVSRGDNSGTHQKEMQVWAKAGIAPTLPSVAATQEGAAPLGAARPGAEPSGDWYIVTKDFMTASLKRANAEGAYFMSDSSTWIMEQGVAPSLKILFRGDKFLVNTYHAIVAPAGATAGRDTAEKFIAFVASPAGQKIIREYGAAQYPQALYNDAVYAKKYD
jgi:tungstate transport system substrate-binding protein